MTAQEQQRDANTSGKIVPIAIAAEETATIEATDSIPEVANKNPEDAEPVEKAPISAGAKNVKATLNIPTALSIPLPPPGPSSLNDFRKNEEMATLQKGFSTVEVSVNVYSGSHGRKNFGNSFCIFDGILQTLISASLSFRGSCFSRYAYLHVLKNVSPSFN